MSDVSLQADLVSLVAEWTKEIMDLEASLAEEGGDAIDRLCTETAKDSCYDHRQQLVQLLQADGVILPPEVLEGANAKGQEERK